MDDINGINVDESNTSLITIFLSGRQHTGAWCVQHSPTAAALWTNPAFEWKSDFRVSPICQWVQKRKLFEMAH